MLGEGSTVGVFRRGIRRENGREERERAVYAKDGPATSPYHHKLQPIPLREK
jgi:hypothetical protein